MYPPTVLLLPESTHLGFCPHSYSEAWSHETWHLWDAAIQKELQGLQDSGNAWEWGPTWHVHHGFQICVCRQACLWTQGACCGSLQYAMAKSLHLVPPIHLLCLPRKFTFLSLLQLRMHGVFTPWTSVKRLFRQIPWILTLTSMSVLQKATIVLQGQSGNFTSLCTASRAPPGLVYDLDLFPPGLQFSASQQLAHILPDCTSSVSCRWYLTHFPMTMLQSPSSLSFAGSDDGPVSRYVGINISLDDCHIHLSKEPLALKLLECFDMPCGAGTYAEGGASCTLCPAGKFSTANGGTSQEVCQLCSTCSNDKYAPTILWNALPQCKRMGPHVTVHLSQGSGTRPQQEPRHGMDSQQGWREQQGVVGVRGCFHHPARSGLQRQHRETRQDLIWEAGPSCEDCFIHSRSAWIQSWHRLDSYLTCNLYSWAEPSLGPWASTRYECPLQWMDWSKKSHRCSKTRRFTLLIQRPLNMIISYSVSESYIYTYIHIYTCIHTFIVALWLYTTVNKYTYMHTHSAVTLYRDIISL